MKTSFRTKYLIFLFCVVCFVVVLLALGSLTTYRYTISSLRKSVNDDVTEILIQQVRQRSESLINILADEVADPLYFYDLKTLEGILAAVKNEPQVIETLLLDPQCKIIHDGTDDIAGYDTRYQLTDSCIGKSGESEVYTVFRESDIITSKPLMFGRDVLGYILLRVSLSDTLQDIQRVEDISVKREAEGRADYMQMIGITSFVSLVLTFVVAWFISSRLLQSLESIRRQIAKIGKGDYEKPLVTDRKDEFGELVGSLEQMRVDLSTSTVSIEKLKSEIEEKERAEEQKEMMEKQLRRAQRMEGVGQLAAGVAHDLNNILSGIVSLPQLLLMGLPEDSPLRTKLQAIERSGNHAAMIVQDMLTLSKGGMVVLEALNPVDLVEEYLHSPECMKLEQTHPGIDISASYDENIFNIYGSPVHLMKVLMNLVNNGGDAIEGRGEITLTLENVYVDALFGEIHTIPEGEYVRFSVSDTGSGIPARDISRIFEPFYTKKAMGRSGTGLGMVIVFNTVTDHNGFIDVESGPARGTTIHLYFPATREEAAGQTSRSLNLAGQQGNGEKILVVDDVEVQREIATSLLNSLGYKATAVASGEEALRYLSLEKVDLVILDMIMDPGINGFETSRRIFEQLPESDIIIASGYAETTMMKQTLELGVRKFIQKPYSIETLGRAVREVIDKSNGVASGRS